MLILLDENDNRLGAIENIDDFCITEVLDTGEDELAFEMPVKHDLYKYVAEESCLLTGGNRYVVKSVDERGITAVIGCRLDLATLQRNPVAGLRLETVSLTQFLTEALTGTGWTFQNGGAVTIKRTLELKAGNTLDLLRHGQKVYGVVFKYDCVNRVLTAIDPDGYENRGAYFTDELNLKECTIRGESFDFRTRLYAYGKDGLTFASINGGREYVEDHSYSRRVITEVWIDERYQLETELLAAAESRLAAVSRPNRVYTAMVVDLASLNPDYAALRIAVGDKVTLVDRLRQIKVEHQIMRLVTYPNEPERNIAELGQLSKSLEFVITEIEEKESQNIEDVIHNIVPPMIDDALSGFEWGGGGGSVIIERLIPD